MIRILRAFAWMRWRALINSFERTGARDTLERFSLAVDKLGPIVAAILLVPTLLGIAVLSSIGGYLLTARPALQPVVFSTLRIVALALSALAVIGPIVFPLMERTNPVRFMLLPIPRTTLYAAQLSGTMADPWILAAIPLATFLPLGIAAGGAFGAATLSAVASLLFLAVLSGLSMLTGCVVQLVMRDRRRGELAALALMLFLPLVGFSMQALERQSSHRHRRETAVEQPAGPSVIDKIAKAAFRLAPSEQYAGATRAMIEVGPRSGLGGVLFLVGAAVVVHASALLVFGRLLAFPGSSGGRRSSARRSKAIPRVPFLSRGAGAVAFAQLRLTLRTPRGRSSFLAPLLIFAFFTILARRSGSTPFSLEPDSGVGLAAFGAFFSMMATLPFAMNQFALDGAGLTLELLSPLSDDELIDGKAFAIWAMAMVPGSICLLLAFLLFPSGSLAVWTSIPLGQAAMCLLVTPIAATVSITFPRAVDLNSVGHGSNPHGLAGLAGIVTIVLSGFPVGILALVAIHFLEKPELIPVLLLIWFGVAFVVNRVLFLPVRALFAKRRENLGMVVR